MRAILIDPITRTVTEIDANLNDLEVLQSLVGGKIESGPRLAADVHTYVNAVGRLTRLPSWRTAGRDIFGAMVVLSADENDEYEADLVPSMTLEKVWRMTGWRTEGSNRVAATRAYFAKRDIGSAGGAYVED